MGLEMKELKTRRHVSCPGGCVGMPVSLPVCLLVCLLFSALERPIQRIGTLVCQSASSHAYLYVRRPTFAIQCIGPAVVERFGV